jgi:probable rRNA maturation factor
MEILVQIRACCDDMDTRALKQLTRRVVRTALSTTGAPRNCETSVLYVGDDEMRRLNTEYRGIGRTTDVLAFAMRECDGMPFPGGADQKEMLGDVVISLQTAARQAVARRHSVEREIAVLLTHGALHLMGYDHAAPGAGGRAKAKAMKEMEARCMELLREKKIV